jgi:hypothetical protein
MIFTTSLLPFALMLALCAGMVTTARMRNKDKKEVINNPDISKNAHDYFWRAAKGGDPLQVGSYIFSILLLLLFASLIYFGTRLYFDHSSGSEFVYGIPFALTLLAIGVVSLISLFVYASWVGGDKDVRLGEAYALVNNLNKDIKTLRILAWVTWSIGAGVLGVFTISNMLISM